MRNFAECISKYLERFSLAYILVVYELILFVCRVQADKEVTYNGFENSNNKFQQYLDCNTNYIRHFNV